MLSLPPVASNEVNRMTHDNSVRLALESVADLPAAEALRVMRLAGQLLRAVETAFQRGEKPRSLLELADEQNPALAGALAELLAIEAGDMQQAASVADAALRELLNMVEAQGPTQ